VSSTHILHVRRNTRFCQRGNELQQQSKIDLVCHSGVINSGSARSSKHHHIQCVHWTSVHYDHHDHHDHLPSSLWTWVELHVSAGTRVLNRAVSSPMPAWCNSSDCQAAHDEIKLEITTRGWDRLSHKISQVQKSIGDAERRQFVPHLVQTYPDAHKGPDAWMD